MSKDNDAIADFISEAGQTRVEDKTLRFKHKYKWTGEELAVVFLSFPIAAALTWYVLAAAPAFAFLVWLVISVALLAGVLGIIFGVSRKKKTILQATYHPESTELAVEGNGYKANVNHGPLRGITAVHVKTIKSNQVLFVHYKEERSALQIPQRIAAQPGLREIISDAVLKDTNFAEKDEKVAAWFEGLETYNK